MRLFSTKDRPVHKGPFPLERLARTGVMPDLSKVPKFEPVRFNRPDAPQSIVNAMGEYQAMMDVIRDGPVNKVRAECPDDLTERAHNLKGFGYFSDASMVGICKTPKESHLVKGYVNPDIEILAKTLKERQTHSLASGIDAVMADLRESLETPLGSIDGHTHSIVILNEYPRDPQADEAGCGWIDQAQRQRACLRSTETACVIATYLRLLGYEARAHSGTTTDVDLNQLTVAAGLASLETSNGVRGLVNPYIEERFEVAVVTTNFALALDRPLAPRHDQEKSGAYGLAWKLGKGFEKSSSNAQLYKGRRFVDGLYPFEKLKRVETTTTYIDEPRVARVPKRSDMFARALFGDMGKKTQEAAKGGHYVRKSVPSMAQRRTLGAFTVIQNGEPATHKAEIDPQEANDLVKATAYFLGADAVGVSACPDWAYYSHNASGDVINPYHDQAISIIIDQGYDSMEGASGDDWISVAQSMRAYLRFSLIGGVLAQQIRNLGYSARAHTVIDGEVLQPPLLLLSGLGEVSRIGEVILNPYLGPRLKSGVVTTSLPMAHDKPIDFGLQSFCQSCNKCARECPAGAITAGPKLMFNGYEIWKSDSQKCATYRMTTPGGAMCGRCMKTCPWNLEGLFTQKPFRWAAMNVPKAARTLAKLDDMAGHGDINPVKKWWWDLELQEDGGYRPTDKLINARGLQKDLDLKYEDQTLAVYPAPLAPHPFPYPFHMDREKGIEAYQAMVTAETYKSRLDKGDTDDLFHIYSNDGESPVIPVIVSKVEKMSEDVTKYELKARDGSMLPEWSAGAHLDVVVAPEFLRQFSMSGDPEDRSKYQIGVLREDKGRGGSRLMHRIFSEGRKVFVSKPINHFPLREDAKKSFLMGGGIGITPMIAFAHRLQALGADFEMHYSAGSRDGAGFLNDLNRFPWADKLIYHFSDDGSRADLDEILRDYQPGYHVYTCGPDRYMKSVIEAAQRGGFPDEARHLEYFSIPEVPDYINHPFTLKLAKSGEEIHVSEHESGAEALEKKGYKIDIKCSDGICGVCQCGLVGGDVEHRDFVLSKAQQEKTIILCQSRAATKDGVVTIDL